ncbi:MAG: hypothetical protein PHH37_07530 [Paludibacter sp.]|nr:hypothetical protein [Paludibacter sp.]
MNRLEYGFSWYLDIVSPDWEALISDNYEFVMPLTIKKKYKLPYIVQPPFAQQLGIFSSYPITNDIVKNFIDKIPYFSYEINTNHKLFRDGGLELPNYVILLNKTYHEFREIYSKNTVRNIEKAKKNELKIINDLSTDDFIELCYSGEKKYSETTINLLKNIIYNGLEHNSIKLCGIKNKSEQLISGACFLVSPNRMIYLLPVSTPEGKKCSSMFLQVDQIIQDYSMSNMILDFEGSKIDGVARFYKGFGAIDKPYYTLKKFRPTFLVGKI